MCGKLLSNLQVTALNSHIKLLLKQLPSQSCSARKPHLILKLHKATRIQYHFLWSHSSLNTVNLSSTEILCAIIHYINENKGLSTLTLFVLYVLTTGPVVTDNEAKNSLFKEHIKCSFSVF